MVLKRIMTPRKQRLRRRPSLFPKKTVRLEKQMAIVVPSTKDLNKPISEKEMQARVQTVRNFLNQTFGGTTRIKGIGSYTSKGGKVVDENVVVVESFADAPDWERKKSLVAGFLQGKAGEWGQETVGYEFEGDLFLVEPA